jgi:DNA-binding transcriptional regulator YiaG
MSVHMKKPLTKIKIDDREFKVPQKNARAILNLVEALDHSNQVESIPASEVFKKLKDKRPPGAKALRGYRTRENMSQKELSELTGISVPNISAYENGSRKISEATAKKLAKALKTSSKRFL